MHLSMAGEVDFDLKQIETGLTVALATATGTPCPPLLAEALAYAVFPGGARVRPRLCLAVARSCGAQPSGLADALAAAIELVHCASLVHDDLPCMDDGALRRGRPSVQRKFGEAAAILVGDGLIALAFSSLASATPAGLSSRGMALVGLLARAIGAPAGLCAGQAWELERQANVSTYHRGKTAALFQAATVGGALVAGNEDNGWSEIGQAIGEAYQIADDLADTLSDQAHDRPSLVRESGVSEAKRLLSLQIDRAANASQRVGADHLIGWIRHELAPMATLA